MKERLFKVEHLIRKYKLGRCEFDESFLNKNTFGIDYIIPLSVYPNTYNGIKKIIKILNKNKVDFRVIGNGSNCIMHNYDGAIIFLYELPKYDIEKGNHIYVSSNVSSQYLAIKYMHKNIDTFLGCTMVPGTIGGAIYMNSSVMDIAISKDLFKVIYINHKGKKKVLKKMSFSYRESSFMKENGIIIGAYFRKNYNEKTKEIYHYIKYKRSLNQPRGRSLGSIYKNGNDYYAGELIEKVGLKGLNYKGFMISDKHANVILNYNGNVNDFLQLLFIIEFLVLVKFNIRLKREICEIKNLNN